MVDIIRNQLVYWAQIDAVGGIVRSNGLGALSCVAAANVYTVTMPANFTVPINRRVVIPIPLATTSSITTNRVICYCQADSSNTTIVLQSSDLAVPGAATCEFQLFVYRILDEIGAGSG